MVFLLHPTLVHATAWIPGRNDSLLGIFVVATVLALDRASPRLLGFAATLLFRSALASVPNVSRQASGGTRVARTLAPTKRADSEESTLNSFRAP